MDERSRAVFDKLSAVFAEAMEHEGLPSNGLDMSFNERDRVLDVIVPVPDLTDWPLRYRILDVATNVGDAQDVTVRSFFRAARAVAQY